MILLTAKELSTAKQFALDVTETTFEIYHQRNNNLTFERAVENAYRGKCGEIAVYKFLTENGHTVSPVDFEITENKKHDADLSLVGKNIKIHIKACKKSFASWLFERNAQYVCNPTASDFICLVMQCDVDLYAIKAFKHSSEFEFKPTINPMPSKLAIYL